MLSLSEFQEIQLLVKYKKIKTISQLVDLLEGTYTNKNPMQLAYKDLRKVKECVAKIKDDSSPQDEKTKFEKKNMVKTRTEKDSMIGDEARKSV